MSNVAVVVLSKDGETLSSYPIEGEIDVGRDKGCVIQLKDRAVSRVHAVIRSSTSGVQIKRKSSFAPLVINGSDCQEAVLKEGDVVSIGPYLLKMNFKQEKTNEIKQSNSAPEFISISTSDSQQNEVMHETKIQQNQQTFEGLPKEGAIIPTDTLSVAQSISQSVEQPEKVENIINSSEIKSLDFGSISSESKKEEIDLVDENANTKVNTQNKLKSRLVFPSGGSNYKEYEIEKDEISIGRGKRCDIVLTDKKSSRKHVIIRRNGSVFTIRDLDSANGTFINGIRIQEQELLGDEVIRVGEVELKLEIYDEEYKIKEKEFDPVIETEHEQNSLPNELKGGEQFSSNAGYNPELPPSLGANLGAPMSDILGISGIPVLDNSQIGKKESIFQIISRIFKVLNPIRIAFVIFVLGGMYFVLFVDDTSSLKKKTVSKKENKTDVSKKPDSNPSSKILENKIFLKLTEEQKIFLKSQHTLALEYFKQNEFDKALFEIRKIFTIVPDYDQAKEIERYSIEGKRKLEANEEEKRKKEEEAQFKAKLDLWVEEVREKMEKKQYEQAKEIMSQILANDPDNAFVSKWKTQIQEEEENQRTESEKKRVRELVHQKMIDAFAEGMSLKKSGKLYAAIAVFEKIKINSFDHTLSKKSHKMILACLFIIKSKRDPILNEAKQKESAGELSKAFNYYQKATKIDPRHPDGYAGMNRIREVLHSRAKNSYTEAVLAESYSDFETSRKKFQECLDVAPKDDIYYERAQSKLRHYFKKNGDEIQ